jgi:wobble nucleotide-excising tRNase
MKIQKIENLDYASFNNYSWDPSMSDFSDRVNLLFGWNGSGKTTFTKVLYSIETGAVEQECTFKIKTNSSRITESNSKTLAKGDIRVFNNNYIEDTLRSSTIPYIFFAGKGAVSYIVEEQKLKEKKDEYEKIVLPIRPDHIASTTAVVIKEVSGINNIRKQLNIVSTYANYTKADFEKRIEDINKQISEKKIKLHSDLIRPDIDSLKSQLMNIERSANNDNEIANAAKWLIDNIEGINKTLKDKPIQIHSNRIDALNDTQTGWIKQGVALHFNSEKSLTRCLLCGSEIKNIDELIKHFSNEVVETINSVEDYLNKIEGYVANLSKLDSLIAAQPHNVDSVKAIFNVLTVILREKRNSISTSKPGHVLDITELTPIANPILTDVTSIAYAIEAHFVAQQYDNYTETKQSFIKAEKEKAAVALERSELEKQVTILKQKAKNTHKSAQALNRLFEIVFPYRKIEITDADNERGYALKRDGLNCNFSSLSEGEKNFIALAYFMYSINDTQNKLPEDGVVVIDDPVSSLDKQSIFQIFSIIVNEIEKHVDRQYLILTHNLDFFNHLKEHYRRGINKKTVRLFNFQATNNGCVIKAIHPLLQKHRSDYYYVFSVLEKHKNTCDLADAYLVVNLLRRWLETFLAFKFPKSSNLRNTIEEAYHSAAKLTEGKEEPFVANALEMYRFINHGSHEFTDSESMDESILSGAHKRIQEAFKLVEILDPLHYKKLQEILRDLVANES